MDDNQKDYGLLEHNAQLCDELDELKTENIQLREALAITDTILAERQRILEAIPQCEEHGFCVPHALEWITDRINEKDI